MEILTGPVNGILAPIDYGATVLRLRVGGQYRRDGVLRHLVDLQYQRNDAALSRARFRVRGDTLEFVPASEERLVRVEFFGGEVERITELDPLTGELLAEREARFDRQRREEIALVRGEQLDRRDAQHEAEIVAGRRGDVE